MKKNLLTLLFVMNCLLIFGQTEIFYDNFRTNQNKWHSVADASVVPQNNKLLISWAEESDTKDGCMLNSFEFEQNNDFTIESSMTLLAGTTGNGLIWNYKDTSNYCRFIITDRDGEYLVVQYINGVDTDIMSWTPSNAINKDFSKNTLKIKKIGEETVLYINDTEVNRFNIQNTGSKFGFHLGCTTDAKLEVDYILVSSGK